MQMLVMATDTGLVPSVPWRRQLCKETVGGARRHRSSRTAKGGGTSGVRELCLMDKEIVFLSAPEAT